jgi:two-component system nitrate/nitrite response regulator NarL
MRKKQQWGSSVVSVLVAEASQMNCQLVESAFRPKGKRVTVVACAVRGEDALGLLKEKQPDIAIISAQLQEGALEGYRVLREIRSLGLRTRAILLLNSREPEQVIDAFRCGARGVVFRDEPIETLGKSIHAVNHGQVWASSESMRGLLEALGQTMPIRFRDTRGIQRLSKREADVVRLVAEGLTNKDISLQLGLSEHTVRNYLFHVFDKLGVLAAGVAGIIALVYTRSGAGTQFASGVAWSLFGASAGFLVFNFPPARIFMGDSGSTGLGFTVAFLGLDFCRSSGGTMPSIVFPLLVAGLPLFDADLAVVRRLRGAASPFDGDRRHGYDLLLARGWSPRRVALVSYSITAAMGAVGWIGLRLDPRRLWVLAALCFAALFAIALRLGSLRAEQRVRRMKAQNARTPS